jgi:KDO2-lipid IV(A) lauroyltransferase
MYYLLLALLYPLSLLPLRVLYLISDMVRWLLFGLIGYRKKIIIDNLQNAFPAQSSGQIEVLYHCFCKSFCDQWIETLKLLSMPLGQMQRRVSGNWEVFHQLFAEGRNIYAVLGHQFNWEWANVACQLNIQQQFAGIYLPLSGKAADKIMNRIRKRSGSMLVPANDMRSCLVKLQQQQHLLGFIADQSPGAPEQARWYQFMNRTAAFVTGAEKAARRAAAAVTFVSITKIKRGYYDIHIDLICKDAAQTAPGFITGAYVKKLEQSIQAQPENWLWSHRRWKLKPSSQTYINS